MSLISQTTDLLQLFQNALAYTVALSALNETTQSTSDYFVLSLSICLVVGILAFARNLLDSIIAKKEGSFELIGGAFKCIRFLINLATNIFTQFLSTIVAQYVITFVPTFTNPLSTVLPTLVITLSLLWTLLYSLGVSQ